MNNCSEIPYTSEMFDKAKFRNSKIDFHKNDDMLNQLDLGDFIDIIHRNPYLFKINNDKGELLFRYFEKIIPVRNRVMHTKPLELGGISCFM